MNWMAIIVRIWELAWDHVDYIVIGAEGMP